MYTRLHGICNGSINEMEDKCPPPLTPNFRVFWGGLGGDTKAFYPPRPYYRRFKIPSFTSPDHTLCRSLCPHGHLFLQQSYYVGHPLSYKHALPYILAISYSVMSINIAGPLTLRTSPSNYATFKETRSVTMNFF